jgi:hypothetical protein
MNSITMHQKHISCTQKDLSFDFVDNFLFLKTIIFDKNQLEIIKFWNNWIFELIFSNSIH